jgi:hypothetical protein
VSIPEYTIDDTGKDSKLYIKTHLKNVGTRYIVFSHWHTAIRQINMLQNCACANHAGMWRAWS